MVLFFERDIRAIALARLVVRCALIHTGTVRRNHGDPLIGCEIDIISSFVSFRQSTTSYFYGIHYDSDMPKYGYRIGHVQLSFIGQDNEDRRLTGGLNAWARNWEVRFPLWVQDAQAVLACGSEGVGQPLQAISPAHSRLIQHYGVLRSLLLQRSEGAVVEDNERMFLQSACEKFEGFLRRQHAEYLRLAQSVNQMC